jgi:hypothetical protein
VVSDFKGVIRVELDGEHYEGMTSKPVSVEFQIDFEQRGSKLTISPRAQFNFAVEVRCEVSDPVTGNVETNLVAVPRVMVAFEGQRLDIEPSYTDQLEGCLKALIEDYKVNHTVPGRRRPPGGGGDEMLRIGPEVLAGLPAWTRSVLFQKAARAAGIERMARTMLTAEEADELTDALLVELPVVASAIESQAEGPG